MARGDLVFPTESMNRIDDQPWSTYHLRVLTDSHVLFFFYWSFLCCHQGIDEILEKKEDKDDELKHRRRWTMCCPKWFLGDGCRERLVSAFGATGCGCGRLWPPPTSSMFNLVAG